MPGEPVSTVHTARAASAGPLVSSDRQLPTPDCRPAGMQIAEYTPGTCRPKDDPEGCATVATEGKDNCGQAASAARGVRRQQGCFPPAASATGGRLCLPAVAGTALRVSAITLALLVVPGGVLGQVTIQDAGTYVVDRAGIIDAQVRRQLELWLRELEQKTTSQVKVLTVASTDGEEPFQFGFRHAELWKLGAKGKDNGALIVVIPKTDRQKGDARIHAGYGIESVLPDSWCGSLARKAVEEHFRHGRYSEGIYFMTVAVANTVAGSANVTLSGMPRLRYAPRRVSPGGAVCGGGIVPLIVMLIVFSSITRRARYRGRWGGGGLWQAMILGSLMSNMLGGRRQSSWGSGFGGFGGGGFGGFGGGSFGGGGRFGGGGGGASW